MLRTIHTTERISQTFTYLMSEEIGTTNLREVVRRNAERNDSSCASHDFCDANMVMEAAMVKCGIPTPDVMTDDYMAVWNMAWDAAIQRGFDL